MAEYAIICTSMQYAVPIGWPSYAQGARVELGTTSKCLDYHMSTSKIVLFLMEYF